MQPYFHRSLAAAWLVCAGIAIALLLWTSCTQLATTDAADDPFAVPTAKQAQEPAAGGVRVVVQRPDDRRLQMRSSCSRRAVWRAAVSCWFWPGCW